MKNAAIIISLLMLCCAPNVQAQDYAPLLMDNIIACEGKALSDMPSSFDGPECTRVNGHFASTFGRLVWLKGTVRVSEGLLNGRGPLGLYISAKASSAIWLNGHKVGMNGVPAASPEDEVPGKMDAVMPLDRAVVHAGDNEIIIALSDQHGFIPLVAPVHFIAIAPFLHVTDDILRGYLPAFLPLGVLILGALYFGVLAIRRHEGWQDFLVPLTALFAAGQLLSEVSRGLWAYDYPFHDVRLVLILTCATAGGVCLFLHVLFRFVSAHRLTVGLIALLTYLMLVLPAYGFDNKSSLALLVPACFAALIASFAAVQRAVYAKTYALALFLFSCIIALAPTRFLDIYFYYCVAALLVFLFAQEIRQHLAERRLRAAEQARADRLQLILDESRERVSPTSLKVTASGKVELVSAQDVAYCKGAGDYVELMLADGSCKLHSATLAELEGALPGTFLRVHRSYLVNTAFIASLDRDASGAGSLLLKSGDMVPVSRRIMPSVRKALA